MGRMIVHQGRITKISNDRVTIAIAPEANECSGCAATMLCGKQEKIEIRAIDADTHYKVGQAVRVGIQVGVQRKATALFFLMPIIILIATLAISIQAGTTEGTAALISLCATGAWYGVLYLSRVRIRSVAEMKILNER